jgi:hypothetical protein
MHMYGLGLGWTWGRGAREVVGGLMGLDMVHAAQLDSTHYSALLK